MQNVCRAYATRAYVAGEGRGDEGGSGACKHAPYGVCAVGCVISRTKFRARGAGAGAAPHPTTPMNSRHSPLLMPEVSCVTASPFSIRFTQSIALADSVTPPMR